MLELNFVADMIHWRGPSPFYFAPIPAAESAAIAAMAKSVSYGWGVIPVEASIDGVTFRTSLFPRDGAYLLPLKLAVRQKLSTPTGAPLTIAMRVGKPAD